MGGNEPLERWKRLGMGQGEEGNTHANVFTHAYVFTCIGVYMGR